MSLYTSSSSSSSTDGWSYQGCYSDASSRTLSQQISGGATSIASCQASCRDQGFAYAGNEYGRECWCGNSIASSASKLADSSCSYTCPGGDSRCG